MSDTAKDLDEYAGDCFLCGRSIFEYDADWKRIGDEVAHLGCVELADEERSRVDYEPDWELEYENRGNE